jgi:CRP/FNR family transcriptional regulator, cyclic AMP receptor protein
MADDDAEPANAEVLEASQLFREVPPNELGVLASMMHRETFAAGETVCERGEPATGVYVIVRGQLGVFLAGSADPVRHLGPSDIFGEYGMFGPGLRTSTVRALEPTIMLSLDYEHFRRFLLQFPQATLGLLAVTVKRLVDREV